MGLYLCVFGPPASGDEDPEELAGSDVGHYSDFGYFRDTIARRLGREKYPTLMEHSDCDGDWSLEDLPKLQREIREIAAAISARNPDRAAAACARHVEMAAVTALDYLRKNSVKPDG